ncbi:Rrf2 family transcriptional regulator [Candidatus Igneacidithiobacillus taiwanensis]|uniref:Rrf2 family transcriptional regulator n=1 Tax=Candidatus Igneacidithiobacillus taiwanensis TaxID=1945924 RepID=UPI0028A2DB43|nr:Rrf2 family transcriptional regulator [Candidatus Igneacidithiobacillus taiwanensis]MCE5360267.1 Rrf2 family transcriptional regulator [Acidithiobacillus sp.]
MKLTTRGRYAVTAMLDLALHAEDEVVTVADISRRQQISVAYLEQLFGRLRKQGLVDSVRGPGGGYRLGRAGTDIPVDEIIRAVNESINTTQCGGDPVQCCKGEGQQCLTHDLWEALGEQIGRFLHGITLAQLVQEQRRKLQQPGTLPLRMTEREQQRPAHG